jgi:hypothetical protein
VLGAFKLGSFPPVALRAVLFTAYVAFFLGAATYYFVGADLPVTIFSALVTDDI